MTKNTQNTRAAVGVLATVSLLAGSAGAALAAPAPVAVDAPDGAQAEAVAANAVVSAYVDADAAEGVFSWDQASVTPNYVIARSFAGASKTLCNAQVAGMVLANPLDWQITVSGDVANEFTAALGDLAEVGTVQQHMTCSCGGNPADGRAILSADAKGLPISYLVSRAGADKMANAITFISADGSQVTMPLGYVIGRHGILCYDVNGEDLSASVGGNNQLWLAGTSGNFFVRDVVEIVVSVVDETPAIPGEGMEHPNSPNVGITDAVIG